MGRFSKLETHVPDTPPPDGASEPQAGFGLRRAVNRPSEVAMPPPPDYDRQHYENEGDRLFFHGDYTKALRMYSRAIQAEHSAVNSWIGQVRCLLEMKQPKEAMIWVKRALELFPEEARLISIQGLTYAMTGMVDRGLSCSDYALGRPGPSVADPLVWVCRGSILTLADNRNADVCFMKAMDGCPRDDWRTPLTIGLFFLQQKKWAKAAEYLEVAVRANQLHDFVWERLGWARERLGLGAPAIEAYENALQLDSLNKGANDGLMRIQQSSVWDRLARRFFR